MKIAVIGCGAGGLSAVKILDKYAEVHAFEAGAKIGGHIKSERFTKNGAATKEESGDEEMSEGKEEESVLVEEGVGFFNEKFYPELMAALKNCNLDVKPFTLTSHFVNREAKLDLFLPPFYHDDKGKLTIEWGTLLSFKKIKIMLQMELMLRQAKTILFDKNNTDMTLEEFLNKVSFLGIHLSDQFKNDFIYPLLSSAFFIAKNDTDIRIQDYSAWSVLNFPRQGREQAQWLTVEQGLSAYPNKIAEDCKNTTFHCNTKIAAIERITSKEEEPQYKLKDEEGNYLCDENGEAWVFDSLVLALPANECAKLLEEVPGMSKIQRAEAQVKYHDTKIVIHQDTATLTGKPGKANTNADEQSISFFNPDAKIKMVKTANPEEGSIAEDKIVDTVLFQHPVLDKKFHALRGVIDAHHKKIGQGNKRDPKITIAGVAADRDDGHGGAIRSGARAAARLLPNKKLHNLAFFNLKKTKKDGVVDVKVVNIL